MRDEGLISEAPAVQYNCVAIAWTDFGLAQHHRSEGSVKLPCLPERWAFDHFGCIGTGSQRVLEFYGIVVVWLLL